MIRPMIRTMIRSMITSMINPGGAATYNFDDIINCSATVDCSIVVGC